MDRVTLEIRVGKKRMGGQERSEKIFGREEVGFWGEKITSEMSCHKRRYFPTPRSPVPKFWSPHKQLAIEPIFGVDGFK
jgi:hypothetical protein